MTEVRFIGSFPSVAKTPVFQQPEFAFIGRSNVGKSSLINYLCGRKQIAKTSSTPGKTQMINLFEVDENWILADLPGYGYARISKVMREKWRKMIQGYLLKRDKLCTVFLLIDVRIPPQKSDLEQIEWLAQHLIPFSLIFTKADKIKPAERELALVDYTKELKKRFDTPPNIFLTSSTAKTGKEDVLDYIAHVSQVI